MVLLSDFCIENELSTVLVEVSLGVLSSLVFFLFFLTGLLDLEIIWLMPSLPIYSTLPSNRDMNFEFIEISFLERLVCNGTKWCCNGEIRVCHTQ